MKKLFVIASAILFAACPVKAQEVFKQMVTNAQLVLQDPAADYFNTNVSQFKYTALQYLCNTAIRQNGGVETDVLDRQAYALNHFIMAYFSELAKSQNNNEQAQKDIMKKFWKACAENPMFENQDPETTEAFINDPGCITPFSINTDWIKADAAISKKKGKK